VKATVGKVTDDDTLGAKGRIDLAKGSVRGKIEHIKGEFTK